ncbi:MAG: signal peptidase I [Acidobacteriota bacterium]
MAAKKTTKARDENKRKSSKAQDADQPETGKRPNQSVFREYLEAILIATLFLGFTNTFVVKTFYIPSGSMETTLLVGDHLFVNRAIYGSSRSELERRILPIRDVERGDVVIFRSPREPETDLVKRCIGIPGDTVEIIDKELYLNGTHVDDEGYTQHVDPRISRRVPGLRQQTSRDNFGPYVVPDDHFFCLGDNRDRSYDSRWWGPVPRHLVKGRALLIYWSNGGEVSDGSWTGVGSELQRIGSNLLGFFTNTRWERTLHLIR